MVNPLIAHRILLNYTIFTLIFRQIDQIKIKPGASESDQDQAIIMSLLDVPIFVIPHQVVVWT